MAIIRCENGHYYDNSKYFRCPFCGVTIDVVDKVEVDDDDEVTMRLQDAQEEEDDRTVALTNLEGGEDRYVTGWLVGVEGPQKGRDYRLHIGVNRIGRAPEMDVQIDTDAQISREHCRIAYDDRSNAFYLMPGKGTMTYLNGKSLFNAAELSTDDQICMGASIFEFVAYCRGEKRWKENMSH